MLTVFILFKVLLSVLRSQNSGNGMGRGASGLVDWQFNESLNISREVVFLSFKLGVHPVVGKKVARATISHSCTYSSVMHTSTVLPAVREFYARYYNLASLNSIV